VKVKTGRHHFRDKLTIFIIMTINVFQICWCKRLQSVWRYRPYI